MLSLTMRFLFVLAMGQAANNEAGWGPLEPDSDSDSTEQLELELFRLLDRFRRRVEEISDPDGERPARRQRMTFLGQQMHIVVDLDPIAVDAAALDASVLDAPAVNAVALTANATALSVSAVDASAVDNDEMYPWEVDSPAGEVDASQKSKTDPPEAETDPLECASAVQPEAETDPPEAEAGPPQCPPEIRPWHCTFPNGLPQTPVQFPIFLPQSPGNQSAADANILEADANLACRWTHDQHEDTCEEVQSSNSFNEPAFFRHLCLP